MDMSCMDIIDLAKGCGRREAVNVTNDQVE